MRIWIKWAAALALLSSSVLALVFAAAYGAATTAAGERLRADLPRAVARWNDQLKAANEQLALTVELIFAGEHSSVLMKAATSDSDLGLADSSEMQDAISEAHDNLVSADLLLLKGSREHAAKDMVAVVNPTGKLIYTLADEGRFGDELGKLPLVQVALSGRAVSALWKADNVLLPAPLVVPGANDDLVLVVAQPILRGGQILGAVLSGERVRSSLLARIAVDEGFIGLEADGRLVTRESSELFTAALLGAVAQEPKRALRRVEWEGNTLDVASAPLEGISTSTGRSATLVLVRNLDEAVRAFVQPFVRVVLPIAGVVLATAIVVALWASRRMTQPLVELDRAAREIRAGNFSVNVEPRSRDEIGQLAVSFNEMVRGLRQREEIKGLFKRYLPPQVVEELIQHPEKAAPGGERRVLTVLFADLVGFTSISETLTPEALLDLLNEHFESATRAVGGHGGTVDKFIGDALMAYWNAPIEQEDHEARACLAALDLLEAVDRTSSAFVGRGHSRIDCRIGINSGSCVVGVVGSSSVQDYTVIGDSVNLASRLEGAAKVFGTRTLVAEQTILAAKGRVVARELDVLRVKGKAQSVRVYELVAREGQPVPPHVSSYAEALALFRQRKFTQARAVCEAHPEDSPSRLLATRCAAFESVPPPEGWKAVFILDSK
jgi:adenylate cyclase